MLSAFLQNGQTDAYTIKASLKVEGLPAEYAAYGEQDFVTWVKGNRSKTEMSSMMGTNITYFDGTTLTSLNDMMGNKTGYTATNAELEAADKGDKDKPKPKVEYTTEKKNIAGYECTKAIITSLTKEKKESIVYVWVTDKLKPASMPKKSRRGEFDFGDLKGVPMALEASADNNGQPIKIIMTTTEVNTAAFDEAVLKPDTKDYKMMSYTEFAEKMKAMQGQ